jgi:hypothetical protein
MACVSDLEVCNEFEFEIGVGAVISYVEELAHGVFPDLRSRRVLGF